MKTQRRQSIEPKHISAEFAFIKYGVIPGMNLWMIDSAFILDYIEYLQAI